MEKEKFVIRTYFKTDLAALYHPGMSTEGALRKMRRWINRQPELKAQMEALQLSPTDRQWTPRQVHLIVKFLGLPEYLYEEE